MSDRSIPHDPSQLADLIDSLMSQGSGHVNIVANDGGQGLKVDTVKSTDCSGTKGACCQPTERDIEPEED